MNEMDLMSFDERQKLNWLRANRFTLILTGILWCGYVLWQFLEGHKPYLLLAAIPVIAAIRFIVYKIYSSQSETA